MSINSRRIMSPKCNSDIKPKMDCEPPEEKDRICGNCKNMVSAKSPLFFCKSSLLYCKIHHQVVKEYFKCSNNKFDEK